MNDKVRDIHQYWEDKAREHGTKPSATTSDVWLRTVEIEYLEDILKDFKANTSVYDIGCGNGFSTLELSKRLTNCVFTGMDYSEEMISQANESVKNLPNEVQKRISFKVFDILKEPDSSADVLISDRCLINIPNELKKTAIQNISKMLHSNGLYIMIENFMEGQESFNKIRKSLDLPEIPVRWHNFYFTETNLDEMINGIFEIEDTIHISSLYYLVTRVVYSKLCAMEGREPDYVHPIYEVASKLPPEGDYGPVRLVKLRKIN